MNTGNELMKKGIHDAINNADQQVENWSEKAYSLLILFINDNDTFMAEDLREFAKGKIEIPPSKRAWGGIIRKAANAKLIRKLSYRNVKNPLAHCTPAGFWEVVKAESCDFDTDCEHKIKNKCYATNEFLCGYKELYNK